MGKGERSVRKIGRIGAPGVAPQLAIERTRRASSACPSTLSIADELPELVIDVLQPAIVAKFACAPHESVCSKRLAQSIPNAGAFYAPFCHGPTRENCAGHCQYAYYFAMCPVPPVAFHLQAVSTLRLTFGPDSWHSRDRCQKIRARGAPTSTRSTTIVEAKSARSR